MKATRLNAPRYRLIDRGREEMRPRDFLIVSGHAKSSISLAFTDIDFETAF
jgi:hypothetical protein